MAAVACVQFGSPAAVGSGVPQMKVTLVGEEIPNLLTLRTLISKVIGLGCGLAAGLVIGSEGPFVHISGCIANALSRYLPEKQFRRYYTYETFRLQLLAVAVSTGVTATFGAPVGGVIFAVEVTAVYFFVSNLPRAFYSSICCVLVYRVTRESGLVDLFEVEDMPDWSLHWELAIFCILAAVCGVVAGLLVHCIGYINRYTTKLPPVWRFFWAASVVSAIAGISCGLPILKRLDKKLLTLLFASDDDPSREYNDTMHSVGELAALLGVKCATFILSLSCSIPAGVFTPTFVIGALCGRFTGVAMHQLLPDADLASPALYSLIGAVSVTAGVTRTVSVAVIAFELTAQIHNMTPILLCTLISYTVSAMLTISIYDVLLHLRNLPYLPHLRKSDLYHQTCRGLIIPINRSFCIAESVHGMDASLSDGYDAALRLPKGCDKVPVVSYGVDGTMMHLKGVVPASDIISEVRKAIEESQIPEDMPDSEVRDILSLRPLELDSLLTKVGKATDWSPVVVPETLPVARVQYLFTMLRLKSVFVTQAGTNNLVGVVTKECFDASAEERIKWGEGRPQGGSSYRPPPRPGSYSRSWAEDWQLSYGASSQPSSDGHSASAAIGEDSQRWAPPGDIEAPVTIDTVLWEDSSSSAPSDTKPPFNLNYSNQDTSATRHGEYTGDLSSPQSPSDAHDDRFTRRVGAAAGADPSPSTSVSSKNTS
ncbi:Chloride Channel [Perkinsus olseni]|uniref:Chloride Channel n=2 Tax=Perkinsus olseni TaxID=32597 RepID=A0A7J6N3G6_PEROL|nr:Chloride Channel [Perkinsus olseni]